MELNEAVDMILEFNGTIYSLFKESNFQAEPEEQAEEAAAESVEQSKETTSTKEQTKPIVLFADRQDLYKTSLRTLMLALKDVLSIKNDVTLSFPSLSIFFSSLFPYSEIDQLRSMSNNNTEE